MPAAPLWRHLASAQMPVPPRRRLSARARRRRTAAAGLAVFALAVLAASVVGRGGPKDSKQPRVTSTHRTSVPKTNLTTVLQLSTASASLPHPLSRAAAAGDGRGGVVLGGLDTTTHTTGEVLRMAADGTFTPVGTLQVPAHDAAAARIGSSVFVFGGGAQRPSDAVQRFAGSGVAPVVARLPSARADLAAVTVGDRVVLVGGYDGRHGLADVLATRDGLHFAVVARLARPVRYPAVAAVGPRVFRLQPGWVGRRPTAPVAHPRRGAVLRDAVTPPRRQRRRRLAVMDRSSAAPTSACAWRSRSTCAATAATHRHSPSACSAAESRATTARRRSSSNPRPSGRAFPVRPIGFPVVRRLAPRRSMACHSGVWSGPLTVCPPLHDSNVHVVWWPATGTD